MLRISKASPLGINYRIALTIIGPLLETNNRNQCILANINHYSKWVVAKAIIDHEANTTAKFFEDEITC
jgi:hypothetical protein